MHTGTFIRLPMFPYKAALMLIMLLVLGAGMAGSVGIQPAGAGALATSQAAHYVVFERRADGTISPLSYRQVQMASPLESMARDQVLEALSHPVRDADQIVFSTDDNDDLGADYLSFYSGDATLANRPTLVIKYYIS